MKLTYGQGNGAIILIGKALGYEVFFEDDAKKLLKQESIHNSFMGHIDTEASRVNRLIANDGRTEEANEKAASIIDAILNENQKRGTKLETLKDLAPFSVLTLQVTHVGPQNASRTISARAYNPRTNSFEKINDIIANEMDLKIDNKHEGFILHGGGMDETFRLKLLIEKYLKEKFSIECEIHHQGYTPKEASIREEFQQNFLNGSSSWYVDLKNKCNLSPSNNETIASFNAEHSTHSTPSTKLS